MSVTDEMSRLPKAEDVKIEDVSEDNESQDAMSAKEQRKIIRLIDWRLIPSLGLMYGVSLMDRKNVSNAYIAGMDEDLNLLVGYRYSLITLSFFITYVLFQPPMTILCRKIGPPRFLPGICLIWGCVIIGFGFANNWSVLVGLRLILGFMEAGFFPGCVYLLSTWYGRYEVARRYSVFYAIGGFASALTGIISLGMMQMDGISGLPGWRWIFIMQGVLTCLFAIIGYFTIVRFPDQEKRKQSFWFLKPDQIDFVIEKLEKDRSDVEIDAFSMRKYLKPARDIEVWGFALIFFCSTTVTYSFAFFLPIILNDTLGFGLAASQCLGAPPYILAVILMYTTAWFGDKYKTRATIIVFNCAIALIGLPILGFAKSGPARYFGVFLATAGANANIPATMAYQANNIRGQWKRAFCSATLTGLGGIGGICGSLIFRSQDAPDYVPGMIGTIVATVVIVLTCGALSLHFHRQNKRADRGEILINELQGFRYTI